MVSKFHPAFNTVRTVKRAALVVRQSPFCFRLNILPHIIKHIIQRTKKGKTLTLQRHTAVFLPSPALPSPFTRACYQRGYQRYIQIFFFQDDWIYPKI